VKYQKQIDPQHCGPTVVSMVLSKYGKTITQDQIANVVMKIGPNGVKNAYMYDIAGHIADLGYWSKYYANLSDEDSWRILVSTITQDIPVIVLQQYSNTSIRGHFRIVIGTYKDKTNQIEIVDYHDPIDGADITMKKNDFLNLWKKGTSGDLEFNNAFLIILPIRIKFSKSQCELCGSTAVNAHSITYHEPTNFSFVNHQTKINGIGTKFDCNNCSLHLAYFEPP